jgi:hypothetical protein
MVERSKPMHVPRGWPEAVSSPGSEDWEATAAAWLLSLVPEYRQYPAVRQYPVVLAFIARHVLNGAVEGARQGYGPDGDAVPGAACHPVAGTPEFSHSADARVPCDLQGGRR